MKVIMMLLSSLELEILLQAPVPIGIGIILMRTRGLGGLLFRTNKFKGKLQHGARPLRKAINLLKTWTVKNIRTGGTLQSPGLSWPPLKPSTIRRKRSLPGIGRASAARPLIRSRRMLGGFRIQVSKTKAELDNTQDYLVFHEKGTKSIPMRKVYPTEEKALSLIKNIFKGFVKVSIR